MANVRPTNYPAPDQSIYVPDEPILATDTAKILSASNWIEAHPIPVVNQNWNNADAFFYRTNAAYALNARWRIPAVGARTSVRCVVRAEHAGVGAEFKFWSVGAAAFTGNVAVGAVGRYETNLTIAPSATTGADEIQIHTHGDGALPIRIHSVHVIYPQLASPLAAPASTNTITPFDENEHQADEPLAARQGRRLRTNVTGFLGRPRVHFNWSGLSNVDSGALASASLPVYPHRLMALTLSGRAERGIKGQFHAYARNTSGAVDQHIYLYGLSLDATTPLVVPAAAGAAAWYDPSTDAECTRVMAEDEFNARADWRTRFDMLSLVPHTTARMGNTTAEVQSIACWSY